MSGCADPRGECLVKLALALEVDGLLAGVRGDYAARLAVTSPSGSSGHVICELGYGDVEWYWWLDGTPIAPANEWTVAVEKIGRELAHVRILPWRPT